MAIDDRTPPAGTIIHSDQGVRFGSWVSTKRAKDAGLLPSMGSVGDCLDNAMMESFWSRMQVELLDRQRWNTHPDYLPGRIKQSVGLPHIARLAEGISPRHGPARS
jgi:transposase InsO family protein